MSYSPSQNVGDPVQIIKCVELSNFQPIIKFKVTFVESLTPLKLFIGDFYKFKFVTK